MEGEEIEEEEEAEELRGDYRLSPTWELEKEECVWVWVTHGVY